jgi:hypothetical protein
LPGTDWERWEDLLTLPFGTAIRGGRPEAPDTAASPWKIEQDYHQLKEELGLDHYEGRSWNGWHHHVTLVMLAHSFLTLETLRSKKNFWVDPAEDPS